MSTASQTLQSLREGNERYVNNIISHDSLISHAHCGAVGNRVHHTIEHELKTHPLEDEEVLIERAVRANLRASTDYLRHGSLVLERLAREEGLVIVGAEYSLETDVVGFFDGADGLGSESPGELR
jgi:hypothetical protein